MPTNQDDLEAIKQAQNKAKITTLYKLMDPAEQQSQSLVSTIKDIIRELSKTGLTENSASKSHKSSEAFSSTDIRPIPNVMNRSVFNVQQLQDQAKFQDLAVQGWKNARINQNNKKTKKMG